MIVTSFSNVFVVDVYAAISCEQITAKVENYLSIVGTNRYWNANIRNNQSLLQQQANSGNYLSCTTTNPCNIPSGKSHLNANGCTSNIFTGVSGGEAQCWGFGDYIEYVIFGTTTRNFGNSSNRHYSVDSNFEFLPGDLIWSEKNSYSQHIRVVYKIVGDTVYCIEGNYDGRCKIGSKTYSKSDMRSYVNFSSGSYVLTPPENFRTNTPPTPLVPYENLGQVDIGTDFYAVIKNSQNGKCLTADGVQCISYKETSNQNTIWKFEKQWDNSYLITSVVDNKVLEKYSGQNTNGTSVGLYGVENGFSYQYWYLIPYNNGYKIMSAHLPNTHMVIDAYNSIDNESAPIYVYESYNTNSQCFTIKKTNLHDITYLIEFNSNNGSNVPSSQTKTYGTALTLTSNIPIRTGYTFKNWNTKADGSGRTYESGAVYSENADLTLYAQWEYITPHTETTITKQENILNISTNLINITSGKIIVSGYKGDKLISLSAKDYVTDDDTFELIGDIDTVKVMVWDKINSMTPITTAEVIPQSDWIIE